MLKCNRNHPELLVTGHSQGGCLATVMALYAYERLPGTPITPVPFASQTAGNKDFSAIYVDRFGDRARWFNPLDFIPMWWNYDTLGDILGMYPGGPKPGPIIQAVVEEARKQAGHHYFQPGAGTALAGSQVYDKHGIAPFLEEIQAQHNAYYYMYLTGIPASVIQEAFDCSWSPPPGPAPAQG